MDISDNYPPSRRKLQCDPMLRKLITIINGMEMSFGLVLTVPGGIVGGTCIPAKKWKELWMTQIKESGPGGHAFASGLELAAEKYGLLLDEEFPDIDAPTIVHLQNAWFISGTKEIANLLARVRLDSISAWSLGSPKA